MCGSMLDILSAAAEIRRGIKKIEDRKKQQGKNIMSASATQGGYNNRALRICPGLLLPAIFLLESPHPRLHRPPQQHMFLPVAVNL